MRSRGYLALLSLALLLALPQVATAVPVHNFDCTNCHRAGATINEIGGNHVCLDCHGAVPKGMEMTLSKVTETSQNSFVAGDASNLYGNNPTPAAQTSHNWAASNLNPAAGSSEPSRVAHPSLYGRYGITTGKVACTRCHEVHAQKETNPKLLKVTADRVTPYTPNELCLACHTAFNTDTSTHGVISHPIGMDYAAVVAAQPENYNAIPDNGTNGDVVLLDDGSLGCVSCHGVHATDSNAETVDGFLGSPGAGDGLMLRHNGPGREDPNAATPVEGICNACHVHEGHAMGSGNALGCMACHGGHEPQNANLYILKSEVTLPYIPALGGPGTVPLVYESLNTPWQDSGNGFCEACHTLPSTIAEHNTGLQQDAAFCGSCHSHEANGGSFGGSCSSCHGYAPTANVAGGPEGYAFFNDGSTTYSYASDTNFKNEAQTAHGRHASSGNYTFDCTECHAALNTGNHPLLDNNYQKVAFGTVASSNGITPAAYNKSGSGSCATVYCHSDGVNPARTVPGPSPVAVPAWLNGTSTSCTSCHNTGTTGTATVHNTHLNLPALNGEAITCGTCHADTWVNATTVDLTTGAHVDGDVDVVFSTSLTPTAPMNQVSGTCAVYCHSNGVAPVQIPDWDDVTTGNCGDCHDADGVRGDSVIISSGSHTVHLNNGLTCTDCHTHDGNSFGGDHINGSKDLQTDVCLGCHGATAAGTEFDAEPVWGNASSVSCETCHAGSAIAVINGVTAPAKTLAGSKGHNLDSGSYAVSDNSAANQSCTACHDAAAAGHFDVTKGDTRLNAGFSCASCHTTIVTHQVLDCAACHDPHGSSNIYMVKTDSSNFAGTVAFADKTGTDSYDEDDTVNTDDICATCHIYPTVTHNTRTNEGVRHNEGTDCFTCHRSHTNPTGDGGAFVAGAGNACNDCHGNPPTSGAHAVHALVSDQTDAEDRSDCAVCHTGADSYTYNPSTDQGLGYNHGNAAGRLTVLASAVGYSSGDQNCASACHVSSVANGGAWTAVTGLDCDACHYYAANPTTAGNAGNLGGDHDAHFGTGSVVICADCHVVENDGAALSGPLAHITTALTGTDADKVLGRTVAAQDDADLIPAALGSAGSDPDPGNATCNNIACHNPVNDDYSATWNVSVASCTLCHGDAGAAWAADPGSHEVHLAIPSGFGRAVACADCHEPVAGNAHRNGVVDLRTVLNYTPGAEDVLGAFGSCNTSLCHNDGTVSATPVPTQDWNTMFIGDPCGICHAVVPPSGAHAEHLASGNYVSGCASCHPAATASTHINNSRELAGEVSSYTNADGTCANSCHTVIDGRDWTSGTPLACADCHAAGTGNSLWVAAGSGTWPPSSNNHGDHLTSNALPQASPNDCFACHDATVDNSGALKASGAHLDLTAGNLSINSGYGYEGVIAGHLGSGASTTCSNVLCHNGVTTPTWSAASVISCGDCHGSAANAAPTDLSARSHAKHAATNSECANCHLGAGSYTAKSSTGGPATHQNLQVELGVAGVVYTANGASGVNWAPPSYLDDGTCSAAACHGAGTPQWGNASSLGCGGCHSIPPASGSHAAHADNNEDYSECVVCHGGSYIEGDYSHADGTVSFTAAITYSGGTAGTCSTSICHDSGATTSTWGTPASIGCDACHYWSATPNSTDNTLSADHGNHFDAGYGCADCHGVLPTDQAHIAAVAGTDGDVLVARANAVQDNATVVVPSWSDVSNSCSNTACHDPEGQGNYVATWNVSTVSCNLCHGTDLKVSGSHSQHINAATNFGIDSIDCTSCHGTLPVSNAHRDGTVTFAAGMNYTAGAEDVGGTLGSCSTTLCHNDGAGSAVPTPQWGTLSADCSICHGDVPASGQHAVHVANSDFLPNGCANCHTGANVATHIDGTVNTAAQLTTLDSPNQTCTNACHLAATNDWAPAGTLACSDCHGSGKDTTAFAGGLRLDRGFPPNTTNVSQAHGAHVNSSYVTANCVDCHNNNTVTHSSIDGTVTAPTNLITSYNAGTGTCANSCHGGAADFRDSAPQPVCVDCHSGSYVGGSPASGLHATTNALAHNASFSYDGSPTYTCASCHSATPSSTHLDGSLQNAAQTTYILNTTNINSYDRAAGCAAACHMDAAVNAGVGKWQRAWIGVVDARPGAGNVPGDAVCDNCHGDGINSGSKAIDNLWVGGMAPNHNFDWDGDTSVEMLAQHGNCRTCHGWGDGTYNAAWGAKHGDAQINLNGPADPLVGAGYDAATWGCANACHVGSLTNPVDPNYQHNMADSGWDVSFGDYGSGDCTSCHNSLGRDHSGANNSSAAHELHSASTLLAGDCAACHPHDGISVSPGTGIHNDGTVDFNN
ncbi:MAG: CxxxxCH/CxxCH domain-containing protein, partial [Desulfuromonadales bacterium]|nr:CxxxxCH/CxxCH domain-containing protein [Desulfuromonadales bacterium]